MQKFERRKDDHLRVKEEPTLRYDERENAKESKKPAPAPMKETTPEPTRPWSTAEQAQLEAALRAYPASTYKGAERWEKVASMVEGRSKKEVLARVKEIMQAVKQKKSAK